MTQSYRLYYAPDNASLIIRLVLEEMGQPYETVLVDRQRQQQKSPAYRRLNPAGLIPVLETPHGPVFETGAILLWLADRHAMMAPSPSAPGRGAFLKWLFFVSNTLHADLRLSFYPRLYAGADPALQAALRLNAQSRLADHLALLDDLAAMASKQPLDWFQAGNASVLTFYLACLMRWMALYPASQNRDWFRLGDTPHLHRILISLEQRPATLLAVRAEGLGPTPFTAPHYATPPEGSAT